MRIPQSPPKMEYLLANMKPADRFVHLVSMMAAVKTERKYLHWEKLRHYTPPEGINHEEWWLLLKLSRMNELRPIKLKDKEGDPFQFSVPQLVLEELHKIDLEVGGLVSLPEPITSRQTRDRYIVSSLIEESITSSQLEGAVTTRRVAKEMIRTGRKPRDTSEKMVLNNYITMQRIRDLKSSTISPKLVFELHRLVTKDTLDDPTAAGRLRRSDEHRVVGDDYGQVVHEPPASEQLQERMAAMCEFANGNTPGYFVHPVVRAIILHFWLAYDHPFVDGNGRTARALFYWAMLHSKYWLFEFLSISSILRKAPVKYVRSFLYTETDSNDLTYFLIAQTQVIRQAVRELYAYIERKKTEVREVESRMRALDLFNHRQVEIIRHALKHPGQRYTFSSHQNSHRITYQTSRTDLLGLSERGVLDKRKKGRQIMFIAPDDLSARLHQLESSESSGI